MLKSIPQVPAQAGEHVALPEVVIDFLNGLRRLPVGDWAEAARAADADGAPANASLRRIVAGMPGIAAQTQHRVRDMVEVAQGCVDDAVTGPMRRVALNAALALATRDALGDENFAQLYGPFEELIPLADRDLADVAPWDALGDSAAVARAS